MRALSLIFALLSIAAAGGLHPGALVGPLDVGGTPVTTAGRTTVVIFISARCPVSNAFNDRLAAIYQAYSPKGVQFLFLDANANESASEIENYVKSAGFPFSVQRDVDNRAADRLGAMATPETFLIDAQGVLRYHGFIEDTQNPARAKVHGLRDAVDSVLAGREVARPETKSFGCTIKRVRRTT